MASNTAQDTKPTYPELLDIPSVTLADAVTQVELCLKYKQRRGCPVLVGEAGLGKTQVFHQIARRNGYKVLPIHAAQYNLTGAGVPGRAQDGFFDLAVPSVFPKEGEKVIVLFDEINRAVKHAINMFFTMLEDRRLFNYILPEDCIVAAAMNPSDAKYAVTKIESEPAIRRRVKWFWVIPSQSDWLAYAKTKDFHRGDSAPAVDKPCHPGILQYFRSNPKRIHDAAAQLADKQYTCPATIQTISEDAYVMEAEGIPLFSERAKIRFGSSIGMTTTAELCEFLETFKVLVTADDVLYHPNKAKHAIQKLLDDNQHERVSDLAENVLTVMFSDMPANMKQTARNFLTFCQTLPLEQATAFTSQLSAAADNDTKRTYLRDLMGALQYFDEWFDLQRKVDDTLNNIDAAIENGGA